MMWSDDPVRDAYRWSEQLEKEREKYEAEEARLCVVCGRATDKPYYNVYPDTRDGVICTSCFEKCMESATGIVKHSFLYAISDAMDEFYER